MARTARRPGEPSATQTLFEVFDPDLERGDMLLQLRQIALQVLAACPLIGESRLDAAQPLSDREVFLLEPIEAPVDLVEVAKHFLSEVGHLMLHPVDPTIHSVEATGNFLELAADLPEMLVDFRELPVHLPEPPVDLPEPLVHLIEPPVDLIETPVHSIETPVDLIEPPVHLIEPPVDLIEPRVDLIKPQVHLCKPALEKLTEVVVIGRRHDTSLSHRRAAFKYVSINPQDS